VRKRIAVDTGGTFTDFVLLDERGFRVHKVPSTPDDPSRAVVSGIRELLQTQAQEVIHGSTVATNALLERKGARIAFVTTAGFEDILYIGRQARAQLYRLFGETRRALVESRLSFGVRERVAADGQVIEPLTDSEICRVVEQLRAAKVEAVAICLLHSYAFPEHEQRLARAFARAQFQVAASHDLLPEYREYERASTTVVNAYVAPVMSKYLTRLEQDLPADVLRMMQSAGGFLSAAEAAREAVRTLLSGPAGGAVGALHLARESGFDRVIGFDMGGTSTDVTLLDGALPLTSESAVDGCPIRLASLDIHTVGAGGGSIAWVDDGGALRVGPQSAGAVPGPACYGSGDELTVTDANLLLGRIAPEFFLGGRMKLDLNRAWRVAQVASANLQLSVEGLAQGIVRVANSNIERALRVVSVQRGYDPRDFALLAFGGAGGLHACELAGSLDIRTVLIPEHAGVLSALGMLLADYTKQYSRALLRRLDSIAEDELDGLFEPMMRAARDDLHAGGFSDNSPDLQRSLDMRYIGQSYEITVPFAPGYRVSFDDMHQRRYGYHDTKRPCEIVNLRLIATGRVERPQLVRRPVTNQIATPLRMTETVFKGIVHSTALFALDTLLPGMSGAGPAIVAGAQSTVVVPPEWQFTVNPIGTLVLTSRPQ
jgi:N-methylhydantoinase A/oxoprolinase/acetone carboxylase beta subunit